jgi:hypothetical protein
VKPFQDRGVAKAIRFGSLLADRIWELSTFPNPVRETASKPLELTPPISRLEAQAMIVSVVTMGWQDEMRLISRTHTIGIAG